VRFWDSSALVPLIIEERHSKACRQLLRTDPTQIVFCFTRTEILSAIWRRHREGLLNAVDVQTAEGRLDRLAERWTEVDSVMLVRGNCSDTAENVGELQRCTRGGTWRQPAKIVVVDRQE
jgi:predicted nucleic acid-binding protein